MKLLPAVNGWATEMEPARQLHVRTREMKYRPPHANITVGVQAAAVDGSSACSPSCWKPLEISQNARLTTTAAQRAITVLLRPNSMASGMPIKAITSTTKGDAYMCCKATARLAVS